MPLFVAADLPPVKPLEFGGFFSAVLLIPAAPGEGVGGKILLVISWSARKVQLRICPVALGFNARSMSFGTTVMRCLRVKIPQSEILHPARSRTPLAGSSVNEIKSSPRTSSLPREAHSFDGPLADDGVRIVARVVQ